MVTYLHIYDDASGESHISEGQWSMHARDVTPPSPPGCLVSDLMDTRGCLFMYHPAGYVDEWHLAPEHVLVISIAGRARITTSDGGERVIVPGDQVLVEDTRGRGHKIDGVDGEAYTLALIMLGEGALS